MTVEVASKKCFKCQIARPLSDFHRDASRPDGRGYKCKLCANKNGISVARKPKKASRSSYTFYDRDEYLWNKYGITSTQYAEMLFLQGGVCAICKRPGKNLGHLHVDHDHVTGKVRGLLCSPCNTGIGQLGDSVETLQAAIQYLTRSAE